MSQFGSTSILRLNKELGRLKKRETYKALFIILQAMDSFGSLGKIFFRGLVTLLPIAITIYVLYSAVLILDNILGHLLQQILPTYVPGLGIVTIVILIFIFGLLLNNLVVGRFLSFAEQRMLAVPLIRTVYSPLKDLMNLFAQKDNKGLKQSVFIKINGTGTLMMGIVTRENFDELKLGSLTDDKVAVYLPFSYGLGGYTVLVPQKDLIIADLPIEKAMSLAVTGWVKSESKNGENPDHDRK